MILLSMLGLCCHKTYGTMKKYNGEYDNIYNDGNDDDNAASGSGSNGLILDPITKPWYRGGGLGDDNNGATSTVHYVSTCRTIYIPYKDHIKDVP